MVNRNASKSPPSTPQESAGKGEKKTNNTTTTTSGKKMKQTRLSFASKDGGSAAGGDGLRKRKLSSPETDRDRTVKIVRREGDPPSDDPIVIIDPEDEDSKAKEDFKSKKDSKEDKKPTPSSIVPDDDEDVEMAEIIPSEDSNSVAPPSTADQSLVEEDVVNDDEEEDSDSASKATPSDDKDQEEPKEEEDPVNESINLDNSSSEDASEDADKTLPDADSVANLLEPPTTVSGKPLTPRQLEKFMEKKSRHEERLRQKIEREKKLEDERKQREERERAKKREREEREEAKRKDKEEKEAARVREKEERERKKQLDQEKKDEERRKRDELKEEERRKRDELKEEERRKRDELKEEERRKREEEKRSKELEEEQKRKRASQAFTKFFKVGAKTTDTDTTEGGQQQPQAGSATDDVEEVVHQYFMPFAVKGDMKLAPTVRRVLKRDDKGALDKVLDDTKDGSTCEPVPVEGLYLKSLKTKSHVPLKGTKTLNATDSDESDDDLMVVDEELAHKVENAKQKKQKYRAKCLMFKENRRPAYYGTWQKRSALVGPRRPFAKDEKFFDYEVESDDEWEEEEPGESLHGSEDEKEKESEDDYEVDNDFFVPHGHLSDEEMQNADEMDENTPEVQKVKLKLLQDEFNDEMKKKTEKIKPRLIGCVWVDEKGDRPDCCPVVFWDLLQFRKILSAGPIELRPPPVQNAEAGDEEADNEENEAEKLDKRKGQNLEEEEIRDLVRLVHGNLNSNKFMVKEFQIYREKKSEPSAGAAESAQRVVTNMSILRKIKEIAKWENAAWVVQKEFLERYGMADLSPVNKWEYALTPKRTHEQKEKRLLAQAANNSPQVEKVQQGGAVSTGAVAPKTPVRPHTEKESPPSAKQQKTPSATVTSSRNSITQFTKVLTTEEKQKQFQSITIASPKIQQNQTSTTTAIATPNENKAPTPIAVKQTTTISKAAEQSAVPVVVKPSSNNKPTQAAKKRVPLLMSVPRGQAISEQSKSLLIKNFLQKQPERDAVKEKTADDATSVSKEPVAVGETIVLD